MSVEPEAPLVDASKLHHLRRLLGTPEFDAMARDSLAAYASYCETMLKPSCSPTAAAAEAHKLRGSAGTLGFTAIGAAAARVEAALDSRAEGTDREVRELMRTIDATGRALATVVV